MKRYLLHTHALMLLIILMVASSCEGQVKTATPDQAGNPPASFAGIQTKLVRTQGSNSSVNIRCGLQDKAGNLWFGSTGEGAYRYDGKSFKQFTMKDGLSSNCIWSVLEDKAGNIWFGTADGICLYDGKTIRTIPIILVRGGNLYPNATAPINPAEKNEVFSMMQDKNGIIWLGTITGVYCYNRSDDKAGEKLFTRFLNTAAVINKDRLTLKSVQCMMQDKNGNIWFGSGPMAFEGICLYDGKSLVSFKPKDEGWIRNILEDKNGNIWFGTRHYGACRYDGKSFTYFTEKEDIGNPMLEDKSGNLWFAGGEKLNTVQSDGGIWRYDGKDYQNFNTKDGLGNYSVWSILEDKAGNIWVGTRNNGLYRYDGKSFASFSE